MAFILLLRLTEVKLHSLRLELSYFSSLFDVVVLMLQSLIQSATRHRVKTLQPHKLSAELYEQINILSPAYLGLLAKHVTAAIKLNQNFVVAVSQALLFAPSLAFPGFRGSFLRLSSRQFKRATMLFVGCPDRFGAFVLYLK